MNDIDVSRLLSELRNTAAAAQGRIAAPAANAKGTDFAGLVKSALNSVNETQQHANKLVTAFELGDSKVNLADVTIATQKANLSFQALTQVRNKVVAAYQDIMNMQV
jgi:flagellar hook-basal body complex protein FliE